MRNKENRAALVGIFIAVLLVVVAFSLGWSDHWKSVMLHGHNGMNWQPMKIDELSRVLPVLSWDHAETHDGHGFKVDVSTISGSMASGATKVICFKTPTGTKRIHMVYDFLTLTGGHVEVVEGCDWTAESGTTVVILNRKRLATMTDSTLLEDSGVSTFAATNSVSDTPDSFGDGTVIDTTYAFGKKNSFTGAGRNETHLILKPDTKYGYLFTSDASSNSFQLRLSWSEHLDEIS